NTEPVPLFTRTPKLKEPITVNILTHTGEWVRGSATRHGVPRSLPTGRIKFEAVTPIRGGTSGGPVVDDEGNLLGLVSFTNEVQDGKPCLGAIPVPCFALPAWVVKKIRKAQEDRTPAGRPMKKKGTHR